MHIPITKKPLMRLRYRRANLGPYLGLIMILVVVLFPFYWLVISALTPTDQLFRIPPNYFPRITLANFKRLTEQIPFYSYLWNSFTFALGTTVLTLMVSFLAAYGFARIKVPGSNFFLLALVLSMALPEIVTVVPLFQMLRAIRMINTIPGLIVVMTSVLVPFTVWVLVSFLNQVPVELEEAAMVDGVTNVPKLLWYVVVPVMKPALATMLVINFINTWNNFIYPLVFNSTVKTLSVSITEVFQARNPYGRPWELISALGVTMVVPVIFLVFLSQRAIISGLTRGSIK